MGRVRAPFGVKGWVKVQPYTESVAGLLAYEDWWVQGKLGWENHRIAEHAVHGAGLVVRFEGICDRDTAALLKGRDVGLRRSQLPTPAPGEYYCADLVGMEVERADGRSLGKIKRLLETGANAVLVVEGEHQRLLPFTDDVVRGVDAVAGRVYVDWEHDEG